MTPRIIVGLASEARLLRPVTCPVLIGGGTAGGAREAAERAVAGGARALLSFGLAGGLDPDQPAGVLVVPRFVRASGASHATDPALVGVLGGATHQVLLAGTVIAASAAAKRLLWQATGAVAVDLESGAVAEVAVRHGLPFAVLRAICDPAWRDLPPAALIPLAAGGRIPLARIVASIFRHPGQLALLAALARDAAAARRVLGRKAGSLPWAR